MWWALEPSRPWPHAAGGTLSHTEQLRFRAFLAGRRLRRHLRERTGGQLRLVESLEAAPAPLAPLLAAAGVTLAERKGEPGA